MPTIGIAKQLDVAAILGVSSSAVSAAMLTY